MSSKLIDARSTRVCPSINYDPASGPFYHTFEKWSPSEALISFGSAEHHNLEVSIRPPKTLNTPITELACMTVQEKNDVDRKRF